MAKFFKKCLWFACGLAVINFAVYFSLFENYWAAYEVEALPKNTDAILVADSHGLPLRGLMNKYGVFNLSSDGDSYFDIMRKIKYYYNNYKIQTVLLTVDDHSLSVYRKKNNNLDRSVAYTSPRDYDYLYDYIVGKYIRRYIVFFNSKYKEIIKKYLLTLLGKSLPGVKAQSPSWQNPQQRKKMTEERVNYQFPKTGESESLQNELDKIIAFCKINNIRLVGIKFPLSEEYLAVKGDRGFKADEIFRKNGLVVLDMSRRFATGGEGLFADQDHLNEQGAGRLAEIIRDALRQNVGNKEKEATRAKPGIQ